MALQDQQAEPSMEEILASIRRIISEEEQTPNAAPVLDLTQTDQPAPAPVQHVAPPAPDDDIVFEAVEQSVVQEVHVPEPVMSAPQPRAFTAEPTSDVILSNPVASQAAGSLARLAGTLRISDAQGQTVEGVVRELLKPMLKEWLDRNLAAIVEARVEAELERIARMSR
jgi:cell pole-organizing protein PopZ